MAPNVSLPNSTDVIRVIKLKSPSKILIFLLPESKTANSVPLAAKKVGLLNLVCRVAPPKPPTNSI